MEVIFENMNKKWGVFMIAMIFRLTDHPFNTRAEESIGPGSR